jgi:hypothetical protein
MVQIELIIEIPLGAGEYEVSNPSLPAGIIAVERYLIYPDQIKLFLK